MRRQSSLRLRRGKASSQLTGMVFPGRRPLASPRVPSALWAEEAGGFWHTLRGAEDLRSGTGGLRVAATTGYNLAPFGCSEARAGANARADIPAAGPAAGQFKRAGLRAEGGMVEHGSSSKPVLSIQFRLLSPDFRGREIGGRRLRRAEEPVNRGLEITEDIDVIAAVFGAHLEKLRPLSGSLHEYGDLLVFFRSIARQAAARAGWTR
jgi:hypothetical protein